MNIVINSECGRIGNILFMYAYALKYNPTNIYILKNWYYPEFEQFNKFLNLGIKCIEKLPEGYNVYNYNVLDIVDIPENYLNNEFIILNGYFQYKPSNEILDYIKNRIIFEEDQIECVVHVRRTDFLYTEHNVYDKEFYLDNLKNISEAIIITDDVDWCNCLVSNKITINGGSPLEDFKLLLRAKNIIYGNSTFAYWGSLLNKHNPNITHSYDWYTIPKMNEHLKYLF